MTGKTILVVDDNQANVQLVSYLLLSAGYDTHEASDANSALLALKSLKPELILMDLQMPGMDGLELTRRLKADPRTRDIFVVALTASAMKGDEQIARDAGCDGYISKPIDTRNFLQLIARFLSRGSPPAKEV